jgi:hypothetical protein
MFSFFYFVNELEILTVNELQIFGVNGMLVYQPNSFVDFMCTQCKYSCKTGNTFGNTVCRWTGNSFWK